MNGPLTDFESDFGCCDIKMEFEPIENKRCITSTGLAVLVMIFYLGFIYNLVKWLHELDNE
jgi:hypothetical protein